MLKNKLIASLLASASILSLSLEANASNCDLPIAVNQNNVCTVENGDIITVNEGVTIDSDIAAIQDFTGANITIGAITNNGTVDGAEGGILLSDLTGTNITNTGIIRGTDPDHLEALGIGLNNVILPGGIINSGTISSVALAGIYILNSSEIGAIINQADAEITGPEGGIYIQGASVIDGGEGAAITNSGTISSANASAIEILEDSELNGIVNNAGGLLDGDFGIKVNGSTITDGIINKGTIEGETKAIQIINPVNTIEITNTGTINGDVVINSSTLNLNTGSSLEDLGDVTGTNGDLNINTSYSTDHDYSLRDINLNTGNTLTITDNAEFTVSGEFANAAGILSITAGKTLSIVGDYSQNALGKLIINVADNETFSKLDITGEADFTKDTILDINILENAGLVNTDILEEVISAGTLTSNGFTITDNSELLTFTAVVQEDNTLDIRVGNNSVSETVQNSPEPQAPRVKSIAEVIDDVITKSETTNIAQVVNALRTLPTSSKVVEGLSQLLPVNIGGSSNAILNTTSSITRVIQARSAINTGMSYGQENDKNNLWLKTFGSWTNQDDVDGISGFDAESYGFILGLDNTISENLRLGFSAAYSDTSIDSTDLRHYVDITSFHGLVYGSYDLGSSTEVNFQAGAGYHDNSASRTINFGNANAVANADYDSYSYNLGVGLAKVFKANENMSIIPSFRIDYNYIENKSYSETGTSDFNLNVSKQTSEQLIPTTNIKFNNKLTNSLSSEIFGGIGYDLLADDVSVNSSFVGGGGTFITEGIKPSNFIINSGVGLSYNFEDIDISLKYEREDRGADYDNQTLSLKAKLSF